MQSVITPTVTEEASICLQPLFPTLFVTCVKSCKNSKRPQFFPVSLYFEFENSYNTFPAGIYLFKLNNENLGQSVKSLPIRKSEQYIYRLKAMESANTWQISRHATSLPCGRHQCMVPYDYAIIKQGLKTYQICPD